MSVPPALLQLSQHSAGCSTSAPQALWLSDLPGVCVLAHGAPAGCVVVRVSQGQESAGNSTFCQQDNKEIVLVFTSTSAEMTPEPVTHTVWCAQGTERRLAAAAGSTIAVFVLEQYIASLHETAAAEVHPDQVASCQATHSHPIMALSWTQEGDGLLAADSQGCVIMWSLASTANGAAQLVQAWIGGSSTVVQPQSILTAGANILSPSASACPGTRIVTIWWPEELQKDATNSAEAPVMVAVAEQLRHPVGVVAAQWSPGSLQHGSSEASSELDASPTAAAISQPALMTVGYDGIIRIWVEVTLSSSMGQNPPSSPMKSTGAAPPSSPGTPAGLMRGHQLLGSSHFCMTLVVQPPTSTLIGFQPDSLRACWGVPCQEQLGPANRMAAGSVMWILAMVDGAQRAKAPGSEAHEGPQCDQLLLWAVEGLAGVVINGIPNNVPGTRALNTPRAVLWGQQDDSLVWPGESPALIAKRHLACSVSLQDDTPILQVTESCPVGQHGDIVMRSYALHSVDDGAMLEISQRSSSVTSALPPRQLPLRDLAFQPIRGHTDSILQLRTHRSQPLAATVDTTGSAMLWDLTSLAALGLVSDLLPDAEKDATQAGAEAVCWLDCKEVAGDLITAMLLLAGRKALTLLEVTYRSSCKPSHSTSSTSNSFASLAVLSNTELPSGYQSAISLSPLEANTKLQDAHTGSKNAVYHVVGSLSSSQVQHNYEQSPQPSHTDALAVWSISFTQSSPSSKPQQSQQQGRGPQSSHSARLQLVGHHQVASSPNGTCQAVHVMSSTQTCAQLVTKDSREGLRVQNLSWADGKLELSSVSDLPCLAGALPGTVCSIASSASCSHIAAVTQQQHSTASLFIWQSHTANSAWQYTQEATILLPDSPTAVAWLPKIGISPTLAVACASKLTVFCKSHIGSWAPIANLSHLAQPLSDLQMSQAGLPVITAGTQIGVLSHTVQTQPAAAAADGLPLVQVPLAHLALEVGGPLPDYAPAALALLIARGRLQAAGQVIRSVLTWLRLHAAHQDIALSPPATSKSPLDNQLLPDTALELLVDSKFMTDIANVVSALPLSEDASTRDSIQADAKNAQGSSTGSSQHAAGTVGLLDNTAHPAAPSLVPAELSAAEDEHLASYSQHAKPAASVLADPYAFNATAFDVQQDDTETEQEPLQQPQPAGKAPDPYAFDMGAFGMDQGDTELPEEQSLPEELHQQQSTAKKLAGDPFAFDAEAFGFDDAQSQQQPTESISGLSDPYAFDAGAFGASNDGVQQQEHPETSAVQPSSASAADPSAFNPGAFGISGEEQPPTDEQQPQLATPQTGSAAADPFAFNPDAFGLGSSAMYAEAPEQDSQDNMPQVVPAEPSQQPGGGDPFAFDAGAFGMDPDPAPNPDAQQQRKPAMPAPYANASRNDDADNGPMRKHTSAVLPQVAANSGAANRQVPDSQPTPASQQKQARPQIHRPKAVTGNQLQPTPLTSEEIQELHQLLQKVLLTSSQAVEQPQSPSSPLSNADALGSSGSVAAAVLPPGLTFQDSVTLLNMANMLCKEPQTSLPQNRQEAEPNVALLLDMTPVDWPALDAAAQKMVRNVQLAVYSHHSLTGSLEHAEDAAVKSQSHEVLDGLMAAPRGAAFPSAKSNRSEARKADEGETESWADEVGLQRGLPTAALTWALLSESQDSLLSQAISQLPSAESAEEHVAPPEFGFSSAPTTGDKQNTLLTWQAMRQVGAGFWLTDSQVVKAKAEALAKAQYTLKKDAHDCALMYAALQKKQLLLGLFRSGNHKKLADFLMKDFRQAKNRDAACKNAYVLLGQHRHELAAAFFVLGGAYKDAVGVCAHEMKDPQLALFLARLLEGDQRLLQQSLISQDLLPNAEEKHETWAVCLLKWLQGQPGPALLSLFPPKTHLDPPSAGTSSDRTVYPGQLQSSQPSTSGRVQSSPGADASYKAGAASSQAGNEALALDLVCYCLQSGTSAWPGQLPSLRQLCKLALQAAYTLEAHGHHVMALESHQVAQICSLRLNTANDPSKSDLQSASAQSHNNAALQEPDAHQQQQLILNEWHDRLITASLLRCLVDTTHPDSSTPLLDPLALHPLSTRDAQHFLSQRWTLHRTKPSGTPIPDRNRWRKLAHQQIKALQDAGFKVDVAAAISSLQAVYDSLLPASVVDSHQEEGAESVATGGLFRSISGMSAISTPRRNSTFSSGALSGGQGAVFDESHRLLHVDSDRLHAVCASNAGVYGYAGADGRPFAAASVKHGIVVGEVSLHSLPSHRRSDDGRSSSSLDKGSMFSAILGDMLEAVRWPGDPSMAPGSPFRGSRQGKPESPSATRVRVPVGQIGTSTLAAHPTRQLFLTGCATGEIYLCQFGETKAKAGYTPMPGHLEDPAPAPQSLFTTPPKSWNPSPGVNFTHWGQPQAVCWSDDGERFSGLGDGGVVATWRLDAPRMQASDTGYLGRSDWCHQGLSKRGMDVTYLGSGSSVLAVAGQCNQGGNIVIWDTQRPLKSGPVARLSHHLAAVTALQVLPGSQLLASADEQGNIAVKDLRMLGGSSQHARWPRATPSKAPPAPTRNSTAPLQPGTSHSWYHSGNAAARGLVWEVRAAHQNQGIVRMIAGLRPLADGTTGGPMLVTGGRDGSIQVWSCHRGRHLQAIERAHASASPPARADGLLSCGLDGNVKLHPFL